MTGFWILALAALSGSADRCDRAVLMLDERGRTEVYAQSLEATRALVVEGYPTWTLDQGRSVAEQSARLRRFEAALVRLYCEGAAEDRDLIRALAEESSGDRSDVALVLVAVGDDGAVDRYRRAVARGFRVCSVLTGEATRLMRTGAHEGVTLWFLAVRTNPHPGCMASALAGSQGLATLSAALGYDYAGEFLALWGEKPKLYGRLVTGMLLRGAKVPELKAPCCTALRKVLAEAQNLSAEDQPEVDSRVFEERCAGDTP